MNFDYSKLKGRIIEKVRSQEAFADAMHLSPTTVSMKLNNKVTWSQNEIKTACDVLDIHPNDIAVYFFTLKVKET